MFRIKKTSVFYFKHANRHLTYLYGSPRPPLVIQYRQKSDLQSESLEDEIENFLQHPVNEIKPYINKSSHISQNGLKIFLQKLAVKPKEARMWLKYFQTSPVNSGLPFVIILVNEDVLFQQKMVESMAWSLAFLIQNNMNPILVFQVSNQQRRYLNLLKGNESVAEKLAIFGKHIHEKLAVFGAEAELLIGDKNPLKMWKPHTSNTHVLPTLTVNTSHIFQSIQKNRIPVLSTMVNLGNSELRDPLDILELLVSKFRPMKTMILGTDKGIVDANNKVISDLTIPSDLRFIDSADWLSAYQRNLLRRCANIIQMLPSSSSVIVTSADTIIQELFTHHGTGTMIKCLEKISKYRSAHQLDKNRLNRLLEISFCKTIRSNYWDSNATLIDTIFVSEKFSAAAVVMKLPDVDIPYLDKIAVHPEAQGSGLAASLWNEICKDYPKCFWRAKRVNESAAAWYNTVSQGSWKTDTWNIYWYGLTSYEEVLPLIQAASNRPESFLSENSNLIDFLM